MMNAIMKAKSPRPELNPVPLIGPVKDMLRLRDESFDDEVSFARFPDRATWATHSPAEVIADVVGRLQLVYDALSPVHAEWAARRTAARDECLALTGVELAAALDRRSAIGREWQTVVILRASELLEEHDLYPAEAGEGHAGSITSLACGGDYFPGCSAALSTEEPGIRYAIRLAMSFGCGTTTSAQAARARDSLRAGNMQWRD